MYFKFFKNLREQTSKSNKQDEYSEKTGENLKTANKNRMSYYFENRNQMCHELHQDIYEELTKNFPKNCIMILFLINENHKEIFIPFIEQLILKYVKLNYSRLF